uniref:Uncharacterized protein n=1 Tax=Lepeophtheirus salmonis TaxID=72036 RepID=A0A0K2U8W6_LEPSM
MKNILPSRSRFESNPRRSQSSPISSSSKLQKKSIPTCEPDNDPDSTRGKSGLHGNNKVQGK